MTADRLDRFFSATLLGGFLLAACELVGGRGMEQNDGDQVGVCLCDLDI